MKRIGVWQYRRFHPSYLLMWLACGVLAGLIMAKTLGWSVDQLLVVCGLIALVGIIKSRRWWTVVLAVMVGVILGISRGAEFVRDVSLYNSYTGTLSLVAGTIIDDPVYGSRGDQQFKLHDVSVEGASMVGQVFVGTHSILDVKRGDRVELRGKLQEGFGSYQATLRYATLVSAERAPDPIRELRDGFAAGVRNVVAEPAASLGLGFVVGQRSALPESLEDQLRIVGLTHIVVASGYNLTILVRFTRRILAQHSKYLAFMTSSVLMSVFVLVSGMSPSMTRASLVTGLSLLAWYFGRRFHPLLLIVYVAAATAWWYPIYLWSDIGWHLSFLAFAGVLIVAPMLTAYFYSKREAPAIGQLVLETIAAQLMTLPLVLFIFGQLPVLSLLSNVLVAPMIPLAMLVTVAAGIAGVVSSSYLGIIGVIANFVIGYSIAVVEMLASVSWAQVAVQIPALAMAGFYSAIVGLCVWVFMKTKHNFRATSVVD